MAKLVQLALLQRLPRHSRRSRWRRLGRRLASPRTALWAAPVLALPFLVMALISEDGTPSPIEQTVAALPVPVDQSGPAEAQATGVSPFGAGAGPPPSVTMPIYNNSALALTAQMQVMNAGRSDQPDAPVEQLQALDYAELHPQDRSMDDLLVGQVNGLLTMPLSADISFKIFQEFCNAQPGDAYYTVNIASLPIDHDLLAALEQLAKLTPDSGFCPRLAGG
jgi:hypothetical protein